MLGHEVGAVAIDKVLVGEEGRDALFDQRLLVDDLEREVVHEAARHPLLEEAVVVQLERL